MDGLGENGGLGTRVMKQCGAIMNGQWDGCWVLVVQEDTVLADALREELEKLDCVVECVSTAHEAEQLLLGALPERRCQLVIANVTLPDRMGHELMAQLEQTMPTGRPPFVLTMSFGWDPQCVRRPWCQSLRARDSLLYVPFRRDQLRQAVNRALGGLSGEKYGWDEEEEGM